MANPILSDELWKRIVFASAIATASKKAVQALNTELAALVELRQTI